MKGSEQGVLHGPLCCYRDSWTAVRAPSHISHGARRARATIFSKLGGIADQAIRNDCIRTERSIDDSQDRLHVADM